MISRKLIVIAHFDVSGRITDDLMSAIDELRVRNAGNIVLISTGLDRRPYAERLAGVSVVIRDNIGYDFYSWRHGLLHHQHDDYDEIILFNSSFYVVNSTKFCNLVLAAMPETLDLQGMTVSWERGFHAQSYYMRFSRRAIGSREFQEFWRQMTPRSEREDVIEHYELGLSRLLAPRFAIGSAFVLGDYEKFLMLRRRFGGHKKTQTSSPDAIYEQLKSACNPSLLLWDQLLAQYGIVKKQLVHQNPFGAAVADIRAFLFAGRDGQPDT